jgi:hypothetical protein
MPDREAWIQTLEGRRLTPLNLQVEQVGSIHEIAHALSVKVRFTGQTMAPYSVAEHCVRGSRQLSPAFAGAFLLHELSEVYLPDIAAPLKPSVRLLVPGCSESTILWSELEEQHTRVILKALGLYSIGPLVYSDEVRETDRRMLLTEKRDLCSPEPEPWGVPGEPYTERIDAPWLPGVARDTFLSRFAELFSVQP